MKMSRYKCLCVHIFGSRRHARVSGLLAKWSQSPTHLRLRIMMKRPAASLDRTDMLKTLESLYDKIQQNRQSMRTAQRAERRRFCSDSSVLTMKHMLVMQHGDVQICQEFFSQNCRRFKGRSCEDVRHGLNKWWGETSVWQRFAETDSTASKSQKRARDNATTFITQSRLHAWVEKQNIEKGIAPTSESVLLQCTMSHSPLMCPGGRLPSRSKHRFQWLRRWRQRTGVRMGSMPAAEQVAPAVMQAKARALTNFAV